MCGCFRQCLQSANITLAIKYALTHFTTKMLLKTAARQKQCDSLLLLRLYATGAKLLAVGYGVKLGAPTFKSML